MGLSVANQKVMKWGRWSLRGYAIQNAGVLEMSLGTPLLLGLGLCNWAVLEALPGFRECQFEPAGLVTRRTELDLVSAPALSDFALNPPSRLRARGRNDVTGDGCVKWCLLRTPITYEKESGRLCGYLRTLEPKLERRGGLQYC